MSSSTTYPILPLPYNSVLFPGRKLQISSANRQDIIAIIANYYNGAFASKNKENPFLVGCVPLRSPLLTADGQKLIGSGSSEDDAAKDIPDAAQASKQDLFNYGVLAKIHSIEGGRQGDLKVVVEGVARFKVQEITQEKPYFAGQVKEMRDDGMILAAVGTYVDS